MLRKAFFAFLLAGAIMSCQQPIEVPQEITTINTIPIIWKGSLTAAPANPAVGWAYYNTALKTSFIWDGSSWQVLAQDGVSIIWKGELPAAPSSPQLNWAYYHIIDGNSYIYNGSKWDLLAKSGRDGATGILLWIGTLATAPASPSAGWAYHNSTDGVSYIWNGSNWEVLVRNGMVWQGAFANPPANPQLNWAYYDTTENKSYIWDGSSWQIMAESGNSTVTVSIDWKGSLTAAPFNPQIGWMYYNSVLGKTYIWDGTAWEIVAQDGQDGTSPEGFLINWRGGLASAPSNPQKGWAYYNTSQKKSFIWDGSNWQILAQDGADGEGGGGVTQGPWLYVLIYTKEGNYIHLNQTTFTAADFGKVGIGSASRTTTFYITLNGGSHNTTLNLTGNPPIQVSGTNAGCFSVTQASSTSTTTGTYIMDASITFTPDSLGIKTATITIPNNSPDLPNFSFTVTGEGSLWPKIYDGSEGDGNDQITCSVTDSQGNLYFIGYGFELVNHHSGYDWWIKKINNSGNETTSGWDKKLDFNDNYSSYSGPDRPTNAIIDSNDNLIVSDGYITVKFASNGNQTWQKNVGGTLYKDLQNNVFIVASSNIYKYNAAGAELWTKAYTGNLAFDSAHNIVVYSGDTFKHLSPAGAENWTKIAGDLRTNNTAINGWYNSSIDSSDNVEYWKFPVVSGKEYSVSWNDRYYGDGTKTASVYVSAFWDDESMTTIFSRTTSGWTTPQTFTATKSGTVIIKVELNYYTGTYALQAGDWYTNGASITDGWYNGSLSAGGSEERIVPVTTGIRYIIAWNDSYQGDSTKNGNVGVSARWQDDDSSIFTNTHGGWTNPKSFIASRTGNIVVKIETWSSGSSYAGTYAVVVKPVTALAASGKIESMTINSAVFDSGSNIYLAGNGNQLFDQYSKKDAWIKKYDQSGTEITSGWNKKYDWGHSDDEWATDIRFDGTNIMVIGQGDDLVNGASKNDTWVKKFTPSGSELYSFVIPDNNATLVKIDSNENYYFSSGSSSSTLFRKYSSSGVLLNSYSWNSKSPYVSPPLFIMDNVNNVYMYGYASNLVTSVSGYDWIIMKFNSAGVEQ